MFSRRFLISIGILLLITALGAGFILYNKKFQMKAVNETALTSQPLISEKTTQTIKTNIRVDKLSALPDGKDKIKVTIGRFYIASDPYNSYSSDASPANPKPYCNFFGGVWVYADTSQLYLGVDGNNNSVSNGVSPINQASVMIYPQEYPDYTSTKLYYLGNDGKYDVRLNYNCTTGYAIAYLSSTTAETKKINAFDGYAALGGGGGVSDPNGADPLLSTPLYVVFSNSPSASPSPSTTTRKATTTTRSTTPTPSISATLTPTPTITKRRIPQPTPIVEDASEFFNTRNYVMTGLVIVLLAGFATLTIIRSRKNKALIKPPEGDNHDQ